MNHDNDKLDLIKAGGVYRLKGESKFARVVGWYGKASLMIQWVKVSSGSITIAGEGPPKITKLEGHFLHRLSLNDFSRDFRELCPSDVPDVDG